MELIGLAILLFIILFWGFEFTQLMMLSESDFPGQFDKILWVATFLLVFPFAPFVFMYWKRGYVTLKIEERNGGIPSSEL